MLLFAGVVNAQTIKYGIKGGANISQLKLDVDENFQKSIKEKYHESDVGGLFEFEPQTGFMLGAFLKYRLSRHISLQPEIQFNRLGGEINRLDVVLNPLEEAYVLPNEFSYSSYRLTLDYISLPLNLKIYLVEGLNVQVGPQLAFLISAQEKKQDDTAENDKVDVKDGFKSSDFGMQVGLGYEFDFNLVAETKFYHGQSNFLTSNDRGDKMKNSYFQFNLGYMF